MNSSSPHDNDPKKILDELDRQHIKIRSPWLFFLERAAFVGVLIFLIIGLIYLGSFLGFIWKQANFLSLPAFGSYGLRFFLRAFPWPQTFILILAFALFLFLLRRQTSMYRWSFASVFGIAAIALLAFASLTNATRLHHRLSNATVRHRAPMVDRWYHGHQRLVRGFITPGNILTIAPEQFTIETPVPEVLFITLTPKTRLEPEWTPMIGEAIVVLGSRNDDTITAVMVRPADHLPPRPPFKLKRVNERNFLFQP